jgi:pyruvate dehydrogenase E2 component (dihydrolipoamide acetyltransferase)
MKLLSRNVRLGRPIHLSSWRKVAIGTWRTVGDPSVYGILEVDAGPALAYIARLRERTGMRVTLSHFMGRAMAEVLKRHPQINCIQRFGWLWPREDVDIFFQVASDAKGEDLSGMTVRNADRKTVLEITREMEERVRAIKEKRDRSFDRMKGLFGRIPPLLAGPLLTLSGFVMYTLNLWSPLLGAPRDPFGSVMITNIGSLGMDMAFAPLVPYSRVPLLIAMGAAKDAPVARDGRIEIAKMMKLCVTFDHRLIDGVHGSHMAKLLLRIFADPERELGGS